MKQGIVRRALHGSLAGLASFVVTMLISFVQVPLLLSFWSERDYGLWLAIQSAVGLLTAADTGHHSYVGNLMNRYYHEDLRKFRQVMASAMRASFVVGLLEISVFALIAMCGALPWLLGVKDAGADRRVSLALLILLLSWGLISNPASAVGRLFVPMGLFARSLVWNLSGRVLQFAFLIAVVWMGGGVLAGAMAVVAATLLMLPFFLWDVWRLFRSMYPWWRGGNLSIGLGNFARSLGLTFSSVVEQLAGNGLCLVIASGLGAAAVPAFTTVRTLSNIATTGCSILLGPLQPDFARFHVQREHGKLNQIFAVSWLFSGLLLYGGMVASVLFVSPVYHWWTRGRLEFDVGLYYCLCLSVALRNFGAPLQQFLFTINHLSGQAAISLARGALSLGLGLALLPAWGMTGFGIGLVIAEVAGSVVLPIWFTRLVLVGSGGALPIGIALLNVILVAVVFVLALLWPMENKLWTLAGLVGLVVGSLLQYLKLEVETRARIQHIIRKGSGWMHF